MTKKRKSQKRSLQTILLVGCCLPWPPALAADTTVQTATRTRHMVVSGRLEATSECRSRALGLTLTKDRTAQPGSETVTTLRTLLEISDFDWCTGFNRTIVAEWPNLMGSTLNQGLTSALTVFTRTVTLSECTSSPEGLLSCSERPVPVSLSLSLTANGDYSTSRYVRISNLTGATVRLTEKTRQNQADAAYVVSIDGEAQTYDLGYGSLASDLLKETP